MLVDKEIESLVKQNVLINVEHESIQPTSVDLHIDSVVNWTLSDDAILQNKDKIQNSDILITYLTPYQLQPHETVFVKTREGLQLPENLVGHILEKNSVMRLGLQVSGPLYQPTHHTAIFLRVTNLTDYIIELHKGFSIAQITFERIDPPKTPYSQRKNVRYKGEFVFNPPHSLIKRAVKPEERISEQIKSVESKVLTVFTVFMGAFVSSLALIVVNFGSFPNTSSVKDIITIDLSLAVCIAVILASVFRFYYRLNNKVSKGVGTGKKMTRIKTWFGKKIILIRLPFKRHNSKQPTIYIAARYCEHERNQELSNYLQTQGYSIFLPENLHLRESSNKRDQSKVFHNCYHKLKRCEILLAVYPFGDSVSAEIGYAVSQKKLLIALKQKDVTYPPECMIDPAFSFEVFSKEELHELLQRLL